MTEAPASGSPDATTKFFGTPDDRIGRVVFGTAAISIVLGLLMAAVVVTYYRHAASPLGLVVLGVVVVAILVSIFLKFAVFDFWNMTLSPAGVSLGYWRKHRDFPWTSYHGMKTVVGGGRGGGSWTYAYGFEDPATSKIFWFTPVRSWSDALTNYPAERGKGAKPMSETLPKGSP